MCNTHKLVILKMHLFENAKIRTQPYRQPGDYSSSNHPVTKVCQVHFTIW